MRFPPRLVTPRTVLRAWNVDDGAILKSAIDYNKDHLTPWVPWATGEDTPLEETERRVATFAEDFAADRHWIYAVLTPDGQRVIGGTGLHNRIGPDGLEVGYWVDRDHINQGLATEVAGAMTDLAFTDPGVQFVEMHVDARNVASARVPQRLGFTMAELRTDQQVSMMIWRRNREE
jgi:RimJ/RimL family protein N-acetyltransferase